MTVEPSVSQVANTAVTSNSSAIHSKRIHRHEQYASVDLEWQPQLPATWTVLRLKHLVSLKKRPVRETDQIVTCFRDGTVTLRANRRTDGFTNADKEIGYQGVRKGDLVIHAMDAFAGAIGVSDSDGKSTPVYSVCAPLRNKANSRFLAYALRDMARRGYITALGQGIRERSTDFRWSNAAEVKLPVPPLEEQRRIAAFLDYETARIDELVHEQQRLLELIWAKRLALIRHYVTKGVNRGVTFKDSGVEWIGNVPSHWQVDRIKWSQASLKGGVWGSEPTGDEWDIPCVRVADFDREMGEVRHPIPTIRNVTSSERGGRVLNKGDLVLEKSGGGDNQPVGNVVLYTGSKPAVCSNFTSRIQLSSDMNPSYWRFVHRALYSVRRNVASIKQTSGIQNLDTDSYSNELVPFPPQDEQFAIANLIEKETRAIERLAGEVTSGINQLLERRSALINAAVTGKFDLRNWHPSEQVEAAEVA